MDKNTTDQKTIDRFRQLQEKRREIMALPSEEALDRILDDPQPVALVHSLPTTDFYLLVHDIGPDDSLPLLELASDRQWDHIMDLESWQHERLDIDAASRWMDLLLTADPNRFVRWSLDKRLDFIELYLWRNLEVRIREHDQDPSDFGPDFFSLDNHYYVRIIDLPVPRDETVFNEEHRQGFINKFLQRLADYHHLAYQSLLLETAHIIPAETEETALHWRNVRLAEKGFLPFDESVGIYQALKPEASVYGCQPDTGASLAASFKAGKPVEVDFKQSFVESAGAPFVYPEMWGLAKQVLDGAVVASIEDTADAVRLLAERNRIIAEGAGAISVAAALAGKAGSGKVVCIVSGGSIDLEKLVKIFQGKIPE